MRFNMSVDMVLRVVLRGVIGRRVAQLPVDLSGFGKVMIPPRV